MAEVLGVVASGIAVVDAAGNIGSGIIKLRRLWNEVKDVPDTVKSLMKQLELLAIVIGEMELMHQSRMGDATLRPFNSQGMQMSMTRCREAMDALEDLVAKLTQHVDSQKRLKRAKAKLKVALGKDDLNQCQGRLSDTVQLLQLAQSCYQMSLNGVMLQRLIALPIRVESQSELNIRAIESATDRSRTKRQSEEIELAEIGEIDNSESNSAVILGQKVPWMRSWDNAKRSFGPFASFAWDSSETKDRESGFVRRDFHLRLEMAQWLSGKSWEIQVARAMSGWHHHLKTYNIIPEDSEVIQCARNRNLSRIKYLFANKLASIHDRDIKGGSLLHHAVARRREFRTEIESTYELAKFLHSCGLDMAEDTRDYISPLRICSSYPKWEKYCPWLLNCWQSSPAADDSDVAELAKVFDKRYTTYPAFAEFQPTIQPHFYGIPLVERVRTWLCSDLVDDRLFRKVVRETGVILRSDAIDLADCDINLLSLATRSFFRNQFVFGYNQNSWDQFMHDLVLAIGDVNLQQVVHIYYYNSGFNWVADDANPFMTCVLTATYTFFHSKNVSPKRSFERHLHTEVIKWLQILQDCNIDLDSYGRHEHGMIFGEDGMNWWLGSVQEAWAWTGFSWGPNPSDWVFHLDRVVERFSGNFWQLIDNPIQQVPGAWIDNDDKYPVWDFVDLYPDDSEPELEDESGDDSDHESDDESSDDACD